MKKDWCKIFKWVGGIVFRQGLKRVAANYGVHLDKKDMLLLDHIYNLVEEWARGEFRSARLAGGREYDTGKAKRIRSIQKATHFDELLASTDLGKKLSIRDIRKVREDVWKRKQRRGKSR